MPFTGLRPDALDFFAELAAHNTKEWWLANRARYDESVRGPFEELGEALADEFGPVKIFRPFRDVRFSTDKTPYKVHIGMVTRETTAHYLQLGEGGLLIGGGVFDLPTPALARFRRLVDDPRTSGDVEATIEELDDAGFSLMTDGAVRTAPRGFSIDHPRIGLLRLTRLAISRAEPPAGWMWDAGAVDVISQRWRTVSVWNEWLAENLGEELVARR
jgi:uncharacterized protein (TIGR02453 family)